MGVSSQECPAVRPKPGSRGRENMVRASPFAFIFGRNLKRVHSVVSFHLSETPSRAFLIFLAAIFPNGEDGH